MNNFARSSVSATVPVFGALLAAVLCVACLAVFGDAYSRGLTWSGLNPGGGGPGFLLLLTAAGCSFLVRPRWVRALGPVLTVVEAAASAGIAALILSLLMRSGLTDSVIPTAPVVSGVFGAFFVPRIVLNILHHAWREAERSVSSAGASSLLGQPVNPS